MSNLNKNKKKTQNKSKNKTQNKSKNKTQNKIQNKFIKYGGNMCELNNFIDYPELHINKKFNKLGISEQAFDNRYSWNNNNINSLDNSLNICKELKGGFSSKKNKKRRKKVKGGGYYLQLGNEKIGGQSIISNYDECLL